MKLLHVSSRSAVVLVEAPGLYETEKPYVYTLSETADGKKRWPRMPMTPREETSSRKVLSFYALFPDTPYSLRADFGDGVTEEIAFRMGYIDAAQVERLAKPLLKNEYGKYLKRIIKE